MSLKRMDNVGIVVEDLPAAIAFFKELGLEIEGEATVEGPWVDHCVGLKDTKSDICVMVTPDGHSKIELTKFQRPMAIDIGLSTAPENTLGMFRIMFAVDDIDDTVARLQKNHRAKLVDEIVNYENIYRLCYLRGPEGITIALAQELKK